MTRLEQIEHRIDYLLSQYDERKNEPGYKLQLAILCSERKALLNNQQQPLQDADDV